MSWGPIARTLLGTTETSCSATDAFRDALKSAKNVRRLSTKELARLLRRSPKGVERILSGENAPSFDTLIVACRELDECWAAVQRMAGRDRPANLDDAADKLAALAAELRGRRAA